MVICDIMTGYLGAIGVKAALLRRAKEGGSYRVDVSLAQCCSYIMSLGLNDKETIDNLENLGPEHQIIAYASRAFALYYMLQCVVAMVVAWQDKTIPKREFRLVSFAFLAVICLLVAIRACLFGSTRVDTLDLVDPN